MKILNSKNKSQQATKAINNCWSSPTSENPGRFSDGVYLPAEGRLAKWSAETRNQS